ncbi:MAG: O-antigen ligase family protein [Methylococcales bacterium]|nr:O-antigen ligase family protein [Methylococcales bacterium]
MRQLNIKTFFTSLHGVQSLSLLVIILTLPSFEAPKTVFLILFVTLFLLSHRNLSAFKRWALGDCLLVAWMLVGFVVAAFAEVHHKEWSGASNALLIPLFLFCLKNSQFNNKEISLFLVSAILGTLLASIYGLWKLYSHQKFFLELSSVGHVNHSSVYICIAYAIALAMTLTQSYSSHRFTWPLLIANVIIFGSLIILSGSRGSALAMGIITLFYGLIWTRKSKKPLLILLMAALIVNGGVYLKKASMVQETLEKTASNNSSFNSLDERVKIWNSALLVWRHNPVFGIGIKNFHQATPERQKNWLTEENKIYTDKIYHPSSHGHSLYLNILAEQGLIGFSVIFMNLIYICYLLYRHMPKQEDRPMYWLLWLSAVGAMQVILINGIFNTTLHHEHGLLSVLIIGLWWARIKEPVIEQHE